MPYHIKQHWPMYQIEHWDYDFIFDKEYEATAFMIGYL
jgi:hypothetical protein